MVDVFELTDIVERIIPDLEKHERHWVIVGTVAGISLSATGGKMTISSLIEATDPTNGRWLIYFDSMGDVSGCIHAHDSCVPDTDDDKVELQHLISPYGDTLAISRDIKCRVYAERTLTYIRTRRTRSKTYDLQRRFWGPHKGAPYVRSDCTDAPWFNEPALREHTHGLIRTAMALGQLIVAVGVTNLRTWSLGSAFSALRAAFVLKQYRIFFTANSAVGFITWAWISTARKDFSKFKDGKCRPTEDLWNDGKTLMFCDGGGDVDEIGAHIRALTRELCGCDTTIVVSDRCAPIARALHP